VVAFGDPLRLRALLDAETRALVIACIAPWGSVEAGAVRAGLSGSDAGYVAGRVDMARRVAARLDPVPTADASDRLAHIALLDPVADVRRFALLALATVATPEALLPVASRLLLDPDPLVRVFACRYAGPPGAARLPTFRRHRVAPNDVAIDRAIARIQSRLGNAERGRLSTGGARG
jgi:hypothetical protein